MHSPSNIRGPRRTLALMTATALALALAACNGPAPEEQDQALDQAQQAAAEAAAPAPDAATPPAGSCDASQVQGLVGQPYSDAVGEQARQDAGAEKVRTLKPNQPITMEYLGERLNIEVDENNLVSGVRCG